MRVHSLILLLPLAFGAQARGDEKPAAPDEGQKKFAAVMKEMAEHLRKTEGYTLTVETRWKTEGQGPAREGTNHYRLVAGPSGQFRIEIHTGAAKTPELVVVSDGKKLTRRLTTRNWYSQVTEGNPAVEVRHCSLTHLSLDGSGIEFLLRPDMAGHAQAQASRMEYAGVVPLDGAKTHHFKFVSGGNKEVALWMGAEGAPLTRRFARTVTLPLPEDKSLKLTTTSNFTWKAGEAAADTFDATPPKGARKVEDLHTALVNGVTDSLLGKPAPEIVVGKLDGGTTTVAPAGMKKVVVLSFWASWNVPGVEELPALNKLVKDYTAKGAAFYAVNVGEQAADVKAFLAKRTFESTVILDTDGKATDAYGVTSIPVVVLIGKDGTVQSVIRGTRPETREQVAKDLDALLAGKSLVEGDRD